MNNRRTFLQQAGLVAVGAAVIPQWACSKNTAMAYKSGDHLDKFGIQLYTLRDDMPKNPKGVIKQLSAFGYKQIEGFEGKQGIFWDMTPKDFKKYVNDLGIEMISSHCRVQDNFEQKAAQAAEAGLSYLICPFIGPQKSVEEWKNVTDLFNKCGETCRKNGIRFAYHNHEYSFKAFSGMIPQDFLMDKTDPDLVDFQMDIYWVVTGGADPAQYLTKYKNRFRLVHVKDRAKNAGDERDASVNLGTGTIDFPRVLKSATENGVKYYIVEQERYDGTTPIDCAKGNATYLKNFRFA